MSCCVCHLLDLSISIRDVSNSLCGKSETVTEKITERSSSEKKTSDSSDRSE